MNVGFVRDVETLVPEFVSTLAFRRLPFSSNTSRNCSVHSACASFWSRSARVSHHALITPVMSGTKTVGSG